MIFLVKARIGLNQLNFEFYNILEIKKWGWIKLVFCLNEITLDSLVMKNELEMKIIN